MWCAYWYMYQTRGAGRNTGCPISVLHCWHMRWKIGRQWQTKVVASVVGIVVVVGAVVLLGWLIPGLNLYLTTQVVPYDGYVSIIEYPYGDKVLPDGTIRQGGMCYELPGGTADSPQGCQEIRPNEQHLNSPRAMAPFFKPASVEVLPASEQGRFQALRSCRDEARKLYTIVVAASECPGPTTTLGYIFANPAPQEEFAGAPLYRCHTDPVDWYGERVTTDKRDCYGVVDRIDTLGYIFDVAQYQATGGSRGSVPSATSSPSTSVVGSSGTSVTGSASRATPTATTRAAASQVPVRGGSQETVSGDAEVATLSPKGGEEEKLTVSDERAAPPLKVVKPASPVSRSSTTTTVEAQVSWGQRLALFWQRILDAARDLLVDREGTP